jgi:DNA polymerase-3 subunit epsilon/ATP-dependent DNA helicase DinG
MKQTYIALDLETTGFDPISDQVLEIAAIKFQGDTILETFETLINPGVEIPAMVSHITGISAGTVQDAPYFEQVMDNLTKFLGNYPIVGHNIEFDLNFLESKGIPILGKPIDTLKLAGILLADLPSLSLDTISRQLKITHENKHRALSDAKVCLELFQILTEKITRIPAPILARIKEIIPRCNWELSELFMDAIPASPKTTSGSANEANQDIPELVVNDSHRDPDSFVELLGKTSPLQQLISHYEHRPGQQRLLKKILQAFNEQFNLIAEAGTGTGKTMAYLMSAGYARKFLGKKTVISTYTNHLQDQLVNKDFPLLKKIFPELTLTVLKGRKKYINLTRFHQLMDKPFLEEHELTSIIKTLIWLNHTQTGDLDELNLQNKEAQIYEEICSDPEHPTPPSSHRDYLEEARNRANSADIVVVNHALLLQDHLTDNSILPPNPLLIIDEAHHLEKTLTDTMTVALSQSRLERIWDKLLGHLGKIKSTHPDYDVEIGGFLDKVRKNNPYSLQLTEKVFENCRLMLEKVISPLSGPSVQIGLNQQLLQSQQWTQIVTLCQEIITPLEDLETSLEKIRQTLDYQEIEHNDYSSAAKDLLAYLRNIKNLLEQPQNKIIWISRGFDDSIHLCFAPLSVKEMFLEKIFPSYDSVILTSATLSTYGNFAYIRSELGLGEEFEEIKVPSHFSYPDQVKIIIPEDLSDPKDPQYINQSGHIINSVINKNGGKTLVLFTAKKDLAKIFHDLAPGLKSIGINLLAQNISGGRGKIISHFQDEPDHCAILGTNSFWEGVDLIGPVLTCVVIQKLPFDPPDDPIVRARSSQFSKPFEQYSLPRAILRFKQGFGRLIRSSRDTGAVIILDSRLVQKTYGQEFISSLPEGIKIHQCLQTEVADFL